MHQLDNLLEMEFEEKELKTFELKENDILICEGGEVGRTAIWKNERSNVFFQKAIHRARIKTNNITPLYTVMLKPSFNRCYRARFRAGCRHLFAPNFVNLENLRNFERTVFSSIGGNFCIGSFLRKDKSVCRGLSRGSLES